MPATKFICPNGQRIRIADCLRSCPNSQRCMFLPTLRAVADSLDRNIAEPTVTELISGVRETYLKKTSAYAVAPASILYALQGQAIHSINEQQTQGEILSEERLKDDITSGQFDLFGKILDTDEGVLGDLKITSSFKLMKALGIYKAKRRLKLSRPLAIYPDFHRISSLSNRLVHLKFCRRLDVDRETW